MVTGTSGDNLSFKKIVKKLADSDKDKIIVISILLLSGLIFWEPKLMYHLD